MGKAERKGQSCYHSNTQYSNTQLSFSAFCKSRLTRLPFTKKTFWVNQKIKFNFSHWEAHQRAYKYAFLERLSLNLTVNEGTSSVLATFWTQSAQTSSVQKYKELMIRKNLSLHFPGMFKVLSFYILSHPFVTLWFSKLLFFFLFFHWPDFTEIRLCGKGA